LKYFRNFITALNNQDKRTQLAIAAVCMLIGVLIVTQLRTHQTASQALQLATESDLSQLVSNLNNEINTLKVEAINLQLQLFKIERASNDSSAIMEESAKNLNNLKIIAGLAKASGPGIRILVTDEDRALNSYDLIDIVTELRVGGAEAISINGIRVVAGTGILQNDESISVAKKSVTPPYEVLAIGNPDVLHDAIVIAGGIRDKLASLSGVSFYITKEMEIKIDSAVKKEQKQSNALSM